MEQALTQLDVKIVFDDFTYHANISISLYHMSQLKIPKQCKISSSCKFFSQFKLKLSNYIPFV